MSFVLAYYDLLIVVSQVCSCIEFDLTLGLITIVLVHLVALSIYSSSILSS